MHRGKGGGKLVPPLFQTCSPLGGRILERLPRLLASKHRVCYTAVADVVGLTLRKMNEGVAGVQASFQGAVEGEYLLALLHVCRLYQPLATRYSSSPRGNGMVRREDAERLCFARLAECVATEAKN